LGYCPEVAKISPTGVSPSMPTISIVFGYQRDFLLPARSAALYSATWLNRLQGGVNTRAGLHLQYGLDWLTLPVNEVG
jgi:hypothetical protein